MSHFLVEKERKICYTQFVDFKGGVGMLHFITGRAGSGKTQYIRNLLANNAKNQKDDMVLIVPEQFSFESERAMLSMLGAKDALRIEVLSFSRLAQAVFEQAGGEYKKHIDDSGKIVLISMALESVKDELELYSKYVYNTNLAKELLHICTEFKQNNISADDLMFTARTMEDCTLKNKLQELSLIMSAYNALLENSYTDEQGALSALYDTLLDYSFFKNRCVAIDAFKGFTQQEFKIISQIMCQSSDVYISLTTDDIFGSDDETQLFSCVNQTAKKLIKIANENNVKIVNNIKLPMDNPTRFKNDSLAFLEKNIFSPSFDEFNGNCDNITICRASNKSFECDFVASTAKNLMRTQGIRCRDIAVIARDSNEYKKELVSAFKKYNIPIFEDERQPITSQPLITLVRCALEIATMGFSTDRLMRYLKTGLVGICDEDISLAENYALMWKIGASGWKNEWNNHPEGFGESVSESSNRKLKKLNKIRKKAIIPLLKFKNSCDNNANGEQISQAVYTLLCDIDAGKNLKALALLYQNNDNLALALEQERIWDMLMEILDKLATIVGDTAVDASRYFELFDCMLSVCDIGSIPQGLDEITIGSAERIRLGSLKIIFIVGANEGVFPKEPDNKGILNDSDRRRLIERGLEVSKPNEFKTAEEKFIAYSSLCSAKDKLYITYSRCTPSGEALSPSVIVSEVSQIFPNCNNICTDELEPLYFIESDKSAFENLAKSYNFDTTLSATLKEHFKNDDNYTNKLNALERVSKRKPIQFENPENAVNLFGKDLYMSATKIEDYHNCPFRYFCKYGIKAKPRKIAELDPMQSGNIVHHILEIIIKKYGKEKLCETSSTQRKTEVDLLLTDFLNEKMGGIKDKSKRFEYLFFRFSSIICDILDRLCEEFEVSQFVPVDFELSINNDGDLKPYTITLDDGRVLKIIGNIDRVDSFEKDGKNFIRIIDYKTGVKDFVLSDVLYGLNMQMLIYLFAISQNGEQRYGDVVPSGILYYQAKSNVSKLPRNSTNEEIVQQKIKDGKSNGMVLENFDVLNAMEKDIQGNFIPVSVDKKNNLKGTFISHTQLLELNRRADKILIDMVNELHNGKIPAYPVFRKGYDKTCEFCDYMSVCGFECTDKKREIEKIAHKDTLNILNGGESDE